MRRIHRPRLGQGIIIIPSAFTLANLFFGFYAIVAASRGHFLEAGWFVILAAVLDLLDGRIARFTRTGTAFGGELDSLVDAISFGVAPAYIMYSLFFSDGNWNWLLPFVYVVAVVVRLARFNIEQGGEAKRHFHGLPSPASGILLASFFPFSQTALFQEQIAPLIPWPTARVMGVTLILVSALLLSHVPYPKMPRITLHTRRGILTSLWMFANVLAAILVPRQYFFPVFALYAAWGLTGAVLRGLLERLPERDPLLDEEDPPDEPQRELMYGNFAVAPTSVPNEVDPPEPQEAPDPPETHN